MSRWMSMVLITEYPLPGIGTPLSMNRCYHADFVEVIESGQLDGMSFDACITEPPWRDDQSRAADHEYRDWIARWFVPLQRLCKGTIIFPGNKHLATWFSIQPPDDIAIALNPRSLTRSN